MDRVAVKAPPLHKGDKIGIVSPASHKEAKYFDQAVEYFQSAGYFIREGNHARGKYHYFSGRDEERIEDFNSFLQDSGIKAIIASRGGYGCSRILPGIDYRTAGNNPRIILGGSDLTALLWALHQKTGLVTFFGPMALQTGQGLDKFSEDWLFRALEGRLTGKIVFPEEHLPYGIISGEAEGRLIGGCLSMIVSLLGTEYFGDVTDRILFIEEIGEKPFRLDRMLTHLKNAGIFNKVRGVLLGDFYKCWCADDKESLSLNEMVKEIIGASEIPVMANLPFGHNEMKMTLPLGVKIKFNADEGSMEFLEEGVERSREKC